MTPSQQRPADDRASSTNTYPPAKHILRDLAHWLETDGQTYRAGVRVIPELCAPAGGVRAGVWATLTDLSSGTAAAQAMSPNWLATSDITLHTFASVTSGEISTRARVLRQGRSKVVIEVDLLDDANPNQPVGLATVGFSALEPRGGVQSVSQHATSSRTVFGRADQPLSENILDRVGLRVLDATSGRLSLSPNPYCHNSLGAVQGGALALMADAAGESIFRATGQNDWATRDITLHYLALGKVGPLETHCRVLQQTHQEALVRTEILDHGADNRRVLVATSRVGLSVQ